MKYNLPRVNVFWGMFVMYHQIFIWKDSFDLGVLSAWEFALQTSSISGFETLLPEVAKS